MNIGKDIVSSLQFSSVDRLVWYENVHRINPRLGVLLSYLPTASPECNAVSAIIQTCIDEWLSLDAFS